MIFSYLKRFLIKILPPATFDLLNLLKNLFQNIGMNRRKSSFLNYGFNGIFNNWEEAASLCGSYDSNEILEKCKQALLKVKNGEAVYERDSVIFDKVQYSWPLVAALMYIAAKFKGKIDVLDFGGSLGSSYYQNLLFLESLETFSWNIVEQKEFVREGKLNFQNQHLRFYNDIDSCVRDKKIDVFLASSSFPYIREPFELIKKIINYDFPYIVIDRTYFINLSKSIVSAQKVPPEIYDASYPAWFFNFNEFHEAFKEKYKLLVEFDSYLQISNLLEGMRTKEMGMIFELRK
ncbi:methyltransferase, TIGR04325 family [Leptospira sp. FAT2]|uniref:methyltransferase, TIGR04325 family n=1 Tax=Leptospira sanjuanensis TaxID=2879643 RepID=UPI001EE89D5C|nr:methyltransferase, TIGR04325 family [Leptospira sanjuanensis]MCG6167619.1 methyltransferase, TIGR04325 family [Leptospira sanjuanensis]MCG6193035.1 methyltransferase, TIGR04325 family [Leptospira sanjuanensis]